MELSVIFLGAALLISVVVGLLTGVFGVGGGFLLTPAMIILLHVQPSVAVGTGLMVSAMLNPKRYRVLGSGGFEEFMRLHGIEMIHGGECGLRFTPSFGITSAEIDLIVSVIRLGLKELDSSSGKAAAKGARSARAGKRGEPAI